MERDEERDTAERGEAICFTAGAKGGWFGAGVIHAWLAADRPPPKVAAGISMGAVSAAAMQRSLDELASGETTERARWRWYRRYLAQLTDAPTDVLWNALPDPIDFFADTTPVKDPACPEDLRQNETEARRHYFILVKLGRWLAGIPMQLRTAARALVAYVRWKEGYHGPAFWRRILWLVLTVVAVVPLVAHLALSPQWFHETRFRSASERKRRSVGQWIARGVLLLAGAAFLMTGTYLLVTRAGLSPGWRLLVILAAHGAFLWVALWLLGPYRLRPPVIAPCMDLRPLLGWRVWISALVAMTLVLPACLWLLGCVLYELVWLVHLGGVRLGVLVVPGGETGVEGGWSASGNPRWVIASAVAAVVVSLAFWVSEGLRGFAVSRFRGLWRFLVRPAVKSLGLQRALLHDHRLRRKLRAIFGYETTVGTSPFPALLVAAPLQVLQKPQSDTDKGARPRRGILLWASETTKVVEALRAALALPGLYPPFRPRRDEVEDRPGESKVKDWIASLGERTELDGKELDLVDGCVIRRNPIPALFRFLKTKEHATLASSLESKGEDDARLIVVHQVPLEPIREDPAPSGDDITDRPDVVESAFASVETAQRRDTELEQAQTNTVSQLEQKIRHVSGPTPGVLAVFTRSIAPERDIRIPNAFAPRGDDLLRVVSDGCRRALETLYATEIDRLASSSPEGVSCEDLLAHVTPRRAEVGGECWPGLPEVCRRCSSSRRLRATTSTDQRPTASSYEQTYGLSPNRRLDAVFPNLTGEHPRIVFVASGGVFRGALHVGVIGALHALEVRPDLVVGASVGSLLGGALAAIRTAEERDRGRLLATLADTFTRVDEEVALTVPLKSAAKQLGIRARGIPLSPRGLRRAIRRGVRSDPGYAALGAPPALLDAIAELFLLSHRHTHSVAREFVAGHYAKAAGMFWSALRRESLERLGIRFELMGTSLLRRRVLELLGGRREDGESEVGLDLSRPQPFLHGGRGVAVFATATDLRGREPILVGRDFPRETSELDFVEGLLASSAFPSVFAPRRGSAVFPPCGPDGVPLADGGMFDNLPFLPAIEILSDVQREHGQRVGGDSVERLRCRWESPDLFLAGALDAEPDCGSKASADATRDFLAIHGRAKELKSNLKIDAFADAAALVDHQVGTLLRALPSRQRADAPDSRFDGVVCAAVLKIAPTSSEHINPTFACCRSLGLDVTRVQRSIADGCFQTLRSIALAMAGQGEGAPADAVLHRSVRGLREAHRLPLVALRRDGVKGKEGCPYFTRDGLDLPCPFGKAGKDTPVTVSEIRTVCAKDPEHMKRARA